MGDPKVEWVLDEETVLNILKIPPWDPPPPWLEFDEIRLRRFSELEIQFKIKELQLQQEKLEQLSEIIT